MRLLNKDLKPLELNKVLTTSQGGETRVKVSFAGMGNGSTQELFASRSREVLVPLTRTSGFFTFGWAWHDTSNDATDSYLGTFRYTNTRTNTMTVVAAAGGFFGVSEPLGGTAFGVAVRYLPKVPTQPYLAVLMNLQPNVIGACYLDGFFTPKLLT